MAELSRKQREIAHREDLILCAAKDMLVQHGYLGLKMDQIADQLEYSKGTIYQHFSNKEEIILALANRALVKRRELFAQAVTMRKKSRERIGAVGGAAEVFVEQYPHFFQIEQILRINSVFEKTSQLRRQVMRSCESKCMAIVSGVVRDGVAQGDVVLPQDCSPEDVVFGLWSTTMGAFGILANGESLQELGIKNGLNALRLNLHMMLDGYAWKPLSTEYDADKVTNSVKNELLQFIQTSEN